MVKRFLCILLAIVMIFSFAACSKSSADPDAVSPVASDSPDDWVNLDLSFATFVGENNPYQINIITLQEKLDQKMPGKVTITTYPNGTLLGQADIFDGVINGTCDIGFVECDYHVNRLPICQLVNYPGFDFTSSSSATLVFHEFLKQFQPKELDDVVLLYATCSGPSSFYTIEPVHTMADIKGKQIVTTGAILAETLSAWGAIPVTLDTADVYEAMRNGLCFGKYGMFGAAAFSNLDDVASYAAILPVSNYGFITVMNKNTFNSMPPSQQEAFMEAVDETFREVTIEYQDKGLHVDRVVECIKNTKEIVFIEGEVLEEFNKACIYMTDEYVKKLDEMGLDGTGAMQLLMELTEKYNKEYSWEEYKAYYNIDNID